MAGYEEEEEQEGGGSLVAALREEMKRECGISHSQNATTQL